MKLGEVVSFQKGKKPSDLTLVQTEGTPFPYIDIKAFEKNIYQQYTSGQKSILCDEGDIVIVWDGARSGLIGKTPKGAIGSTLAKVIPDEILEPDYLFHFLRMQYDYLNKNTKGTGIPHIDPQLLSKIEIEIPPNKQQKQIVAKLDTLLGRVKSAQERLEKIPLLLKQFRQRVLEDAVSGRLTEGWRKVNDIRYVSEDEKFVKLSLGKMKNLPSTWSWIKVEDYLINHDKGRIPVSQKERRNRQGKFPYYGATGIIDSIDGYTHDGEYILLSEDGMNLIYRTKPQSYVVKGKIWVNNHAHVLQSKTGFENSYAVYCFNTIDLTQYLTGIDQVKLTQANLNSIYLPIPPKEEQKEIVSRVESLLALADQIESRYQSLKVQFDQLPQAILAKAFRGELV